MKQFILVILFLGIINVSAQENLEVKIISLAIDTSMQPAYTVEIPQAKSKDAIKMWEDRLVPTNLLSTFKKLPKMEKEENEKWQIKGIVIDEICPDTLSVFTRITPLKDRIAFSALFQSDKGFIGDSILSPELGTRTSEYLRNFAVEAYRHAVQDELDELERDLKRMENDFDGYDKNNRKLDRKSIESESNLNVLTETNIRDSARVQNLTAEEMEVKKKEIKKEEKALKKYSKKMDKNLDRQKKLTKEIREKKETIQVVQEKLRNIK